MTFLLDVNALIALLDPKHVHNQRLLSWFERVGHTNWATCPITENGFVRIVSGAGYPNRAPTPASAMTTLGALCRLDGHVFWADDISVRDQALVRNGSLARSDDVTDTYLLALAVSKGGALATLDRRLATAAVPGGDAALHFIAER